MLFLKKKLHLSVVTSFCKLEWDITSKTLNKLMKYGALV